MNAIRPKSRALAVRALCALAFTLWGGCAHKSEQPAADPAQAELGRLRGELAAREQTVEQLHGKLALLEAQQQRLNEQLAQSALQRDEACGENAAGRSEGPRNAPTSAVESRNLVLPKETQRPVLRLHGEGERAAVSSSRELSANWQPPVLASGDRLTVAPVPSLAGLHSAAPKSEREQAEALYVQALDLVRKRDFAAALRELDAFVRAFPSDLRAGRALFWRGEVLFAKREYARALAAFEDALERDPEAENAPEIMLRMARCHLRLGAAPRARSVIAELRGRFPNSEAAQAALRLEQEET